MGLGLLPLGAAVQMKRLVPSAYFAYATHAGPLLAGAGFVNDASEAELSISNIMRKVKENVKKKTVQNYWAKK